MTEYHVSASPLTGEIYAGRLTARADAWAAKSPVTQEAVIAVAEHAQQLYDGQMVARFNDHDGTRLRVEITVTTDTAHEAD